MIHPKYALPFLLLCYFPSKSIAGCRHSTLIDDLNAQEKIIISQIKAGNCQLISQHQAIRMQSNEEFESLRSSTCTITSKGEPPAGMFWGTDDNNPNSKTSRLMRYSDFCSIQPRSNSNKRRGIDRSLGRVDPSLCAQMRVVNPINKYGAYLGYLNNNCDYPVEAKIRSCNRNGCTVNEAYASAHEKPFAPTRSYLSPPKIVDLIAR